MMNAANHDGPGREDLEARLCRRPIRNIPPAWRDDILAAARAAADASTASRRNPAPSWWQRLLRPQPLAWGGLAAAWGVIFGLNLSASPEVARQEARNDILPRQEMRRLLKQQELMLAELIDRPTTAIAEPPKNFVPRPRSDRREELTTV